MTNILLLFISENRFSILLKRSNDFMNKFGHYRYAYWYYYGAHLYCTIGLNLFIAFIGVTPEFFEKHHLPVLPVMVDILTFDVLPEINPNFWFCTYRDTTLDLNYVIFDLLSLDASPIFIFFFKCYLKAFL